MVHFPAKLKQEKEEAEKRSARKHPTSSDSTAIVCTCEGQERWIVHIDFDKVAKSVAACDISGLGRRIRFACIFNL